MTGRNKQKLGDPVKPDHYMPYKSGTIHNGKVVSRVHQAGDPCESEWPGEGTKETGNFYWDREERKFKPGFPPAQIKKYDDAPYVIGDTIADYYHPGAEEWTDSRSKLEALDKKTGCMTTDKRQTPSDSPIKQRIRERREDMHKCMHEAVAKVDAGTAGLTEETRKLCERQNELISEATGMDAFNVAGRKNNAKGRKYRKRRYG